MPIHERYDADREVLYVTMDGDVDEQQLLDWAKGRTHDRYPPGHDELVDVRGVATPDTQGTTLRRVAEAFARADREPERSKIAIVADGDLHYGLSRMYQAFRADSPLVLEVFRDLTEARSWLGLD